MARKAAKEKEGMGARVERLRKERGWTQDELAPKVFMKRESLKNKELGLRPFALDEACELSKIFHVTLDYLVNGVKTKNVSVHEDLGLSDEAISTLQQFYLYEYSRIEGLNMALRSPDVLLALSRYMTYTPEEKGYYLSESGSWKHDRFIECRMSQELFADVLKQNVLHMLDNAKAGDFDSRRHFEAYEGFMLSDEEDERQARLAEPSEYDSTDSSSESDNA